MELWDVVGYRRVSFKDEQTGKEVKGYTLFLQRLPESKNIEGFECCKQFVNESIGYTPNVSDNIRIDYNRYGKISNITVV